MNLTAEQQASWDAFQTHVGAEIAEDLDGTLATMGPVPHNIIAANLNGGHGRDGVRRFYADRLIGQFFPPDCKVTDLSHTIADGRVVIEQILEFTHTARMDWMLPGIEATGRGVRIPLVVIVGLEEGKVAYEHIYWNQASVLAQIGILDPAILPIADGSEVDLLLDPSLPLYRTD
jgi:carboxymethylenebutenolidase